MSIRSKAKLLLDTIELRSGSIITSQEVRALKHRWSGRGLMGRRHTASRLAGDIDIEKETFEMFDSYGPFQIDKALTESGLAWWRANLLRKDGEMRNTAWTQGQGLTHDDTLQSVPGCYVITPEGEDVLAILNGFTHFTLDNWQVDYNSFGEPCASFPMFTMHGAGNSFTYIARPWQSGGRTELV